MSKIQNKLESLQPYVIGIRYIEGIPFIDVIFKEGWNVPKSEIIKRHINEENQNHYIFFSEKEGIGIDELLDFAEKIIGLNIEREKKHELLKLKVKELQKIFVDNSLSKLKTIKFTFGEEQLIPDIMESDNGLDIMDEIEEQPEPEPEYKPIATPKVGEIPEIIEAEDITPQPKTKLKINDKPRVELPPKGKIEVEVHELPKNMTEGPCKCGPDEYCPKCMDEKGL